MLSPFSRHNQHLPLKRIHTKAPKLHFEAQKPQKFPLYSSSRRQASPVFCLFNWPSAPLFPGISCDEKQIFLKCISGVRNKELWNPILERMTKRAESWSDRSLSRAGRIMLSKTSLLSIPIHFMSISKAPASVINKMEALVRKFIWSGGLNRGLQLVSWDILCQPLDKGGLNFKRLEDVNNSLLGKWVWRYLQEEDNSTWRRVIREKYSSTNELLPTSLPASQGCSVWHVVSCEYNRLLKYCKIDPGSGTLLSFWKSPWTPLGPLHKAFPLLYNCSRLKEARVSDMADRGVDGTTHWRIGTDRRLSDLEIAEYCALMNLLEGRHVSDGPAVVTWLNDNGSPGSFTVRSYCRKLQTARTSDNAQLIHHVPMSRTWHSSASPRDKILLWLLYLNRLPVRERLCRFNIIDTQTCVMCDVSSESCDHLFFSCTLSATLWDWFRVLFNCRVVWDHSTTNAAFSSWNCNGLSPRGKLIWNLGFAAIIHSVWEERNSRIFRNKRHGIGDVMKHVKLHIWDHVKFEEAFRHMNLDTFMFEWDKFLFE